MGGGRSSKTNLDLTSKKTVKRRRKKRTKSEWKFTVKARAPCMANACDRGLGAGTTEGQGVCHQSRRIMDKMVHGGKERLLF